MADRHSHLIAFPEALEALVLRMGELRAVLGPDVAPGVEAVEGLLREGLAARADGDLPRAVARVGEAMQRLAGLASRVEPGEGAAMRAMAARFQQALGRGALGEAEEAAEIMRGRSGSVVHPRRRS